MFTKSFENLNDSKCTWCGNIGHGAKAKLPTRMINCAACEKMCNSFNRQNYFSSVYPTRNINQYTLHILKIMRVKKIKTIIIQYHYQHNRPQDDRIYGKNSQYK